MFISPSFQKSLIVEQFQENYLKSSFCFFINLYLGPRVSHLTAPGGGKMRDPGNEVALGFGPKVEKLE